jgi:hypothetical protein
VDGKRSSYLPYTCHLGLFFFDPFAILASASIEAMSECSTVAKNGKKQIWQKN